MTIGWRPVGVAPGTSLCCSWHTRAGMAATCTGGGTGPCIRQVGFLVDAVLVVRHRPVTRHPVRCREAELGLTRRRQPRGGQLALAGQTDSASGRGGLTTGLVDAPAHMRPPGLLVGKDAEPGGLSAL
jgi:hypothetical protein